MNINNTKSFSFVSLQFAVELAALLQHPAPTEWQEVADGLKIPFDQESQYHPEFDGYIKGSFLRLMTLSYILKKAECSQYDVRLSFGHVTGHPVKQADAVMLSYPLDLPMSPEVRRNDLAAYEPVTDPSGPAMTWVRHNKC